MSSSPSQPDFWNPRYEAGRTPWDFGATPPALSRYLAEHPGRGARALVPGCPASTTNEARVEISPPGVTTWLTTR